MGIKLNLTADEIKDAQSSSIKPVAEGIYGAVVYEAKMGRSKAGNDMYVLDYKILSGPEKVGPKRTFRAWYVLKPNALFSLIALLKALDLPYPKKDTPAGEFEFPDPEDFVGEKVNLKIIQEPYETVDDDDNDITGIRNNIKTVFAYDEDKIDDELSDEEREAATDSSIFL